ncbi:hypothetical protein US8_01388 [Bacillus altitudinis]|nr:hypothetical protein US8_01388 [Bacillus altitudinis]
MKKAAAKEAAAFLMFSFRMEREGKKKGVIDRELNERAKS